jgi:hypothetical protein
MEDRGLIAEPLDDEQREALELTREDLLRVAREGKPARLAKTKPEKVPPRKIEPPRSTR